MTVVTIAEGSAKALWRLVESRRSEQFYLSRSWDYEVGDRLVVTDGQRVVEASLFRHSLKGQPVKSVVELPTSFGCQVRCPHCASGDITTTRPLSSEDLAAVYEIASRSLEGDRLVSFSGIGECSLNERNVFAFSRLLAQRDPVRFTMTTAGIKPTFIDSVDRLAADVPVKLLQLSLYHPSSERVQSFMGRAFSRYDLTSLTTKIKASKHVHVRLNLVLMAGFNDTLDVWEQLAHALSGLEPRVSLRVSQLNETNVSRANGILPTPREQVIEGATWFGARGFDAYPFMSSFNDDMNCGQLVWNYRAAKSAAA